MAASVNAYKAEMGCVVCGEREPSCLDLHHRDPATKVASISRIIFERKSQPMLAAELEKCMVLCSNCHRKMHAGVIVVPRHID